MKPSVGLSSLILVCYFSATLLPIGSELLFIACVRAFPEQLLQIIVLASIANTLGGMTTWWIGRKAVEWKSENSAYTDFVIRFFDRLGAKSLLMAWLPICGDLLCGLAGWAKLPFLPCFFYMLIGKGTRYVVVAFLYEQIHWSF